MKYTHATIYQTIKNGKEEDTYVLINHVFDKVEVVNEIEEFFEKVCKEGLRLYEAETVYEEDGTIQRTFNYKRTGMISGRTR